MRYLVRFRLRAINSVSKRRDLPFECLMGDGYRNGVLSHRSECMSLIHRTLDNDRKRHEARSNFMSAVFYRSKRFSDSDRARGCDFVATRISLCPLLLRLPANCRHTIFAYAAAAAAFGHCRSFVIRSWSRRRAAGLNPEYCTFTHIHEHVLLFDGRRRGEKTSRPATTT